MVLAADLETRHARAAVLDLTGTVLAEHTGPLLIEDGPEAVLDRLGRWFARLLTEAGTGPERVCGAGLSVPGPVDWETGRVVQPPIMPGWDRYPVAERLRQALDEHAGGSSGSPLTAERLPVLVDNDANLMAYAEQRSGYPDCSAFLLVKVSTGIGAGVVVDGGMYRGIDGGAGDIGHIRLHDCQDALRLAREAGRRVGEVVVTVVTLLNPGVLMIAGELAGTPFLTGVRELLYQRAMPRTTAHLQVVTSRLGERAGLTGAGAMVVERLYAPDQADARLAALDSGGRRADEGDA